MSEQPEKLELIDQDLVNKANKLKDQNARFWIRRNITNVTTGEKSPGKLECGWKITSINSNGLVTLFSTNKNEVFHILVEELKKLNGKIFESIN